MTEVTGSASATNRDLYSPWSTTSLTTLYYEALHDFNANRKGGEVVGDKIVVVTIVANVKEDPNAG